MPTSRLAGALAFAMLHATAAVPRRQLGAGDGCAEALTTTQRNATQIAACVSVCMKASAAKGNETFWTVEAINDQGCNTCVEVLRRCPEESSSGVTLQSVGFKSDVSASGMKCYANAFWGSGAKSNATHPNPTTQKLKITDICFPAACTYDDARVAIESLAVPGITANFNAEAKCDIFASFVDSSITWFVLAASLVIVIVVFIVSRQGCCGKCGRPVKCIMWFFWLLDTAIGLAFLVFGLVLFGQKEFPSYLPITVAGLGAVLLLIAFLIYCGIKSQHCNCLLKCVVLLGAVLGFIFFVAGILLQILGKDAMQTAVEKVGLDLSAADRESLQDFMHVAHTLLICVFYIMGAVQFAVLFLAPRVSEAIADHKQEKKQDAAEFGARDAKRRDDGGQAFADKARAKVAKEEKKKLKEQRP